MVNFEELENCESEPARLLYSYLYDLGNVMFKYYGGTEILTEEEIDMIVNATDENKIDGMYLAASDNNRIKYSYSTFLRNSNNIRLARKRNK